MIIHICSKNYIWKRQYQQFIQGNLLLSRIYVMNQDLIRKTFQQVTKLFHNTGQRKQKCTTQQDIETASIILNKRIFAHTFNTPPMRAALIAVIWYDTEKEGVQQILDGTFVFPTGPPKYMETVLDHWRRSQIEINRWPISTLISTQEHIQG